MTVKKTRFVFVCIENDGRSQMAQAFAERSAKENIEIYSAGSRPATQINPMIVKLMKEKGIDISSKTPKGLNDLPSVEMDYLVTMGCEETCSAIPAKKIIKWAIPDPKGKSIDVFRNVGDTIKDKVKAFFEEIDQIKI